MDLYFLRHAIAEERGSVARPDSQRRLTRSGAQKMRQLARGMKAAKMSFDLILASPFLRASETAEIVANVFDLGKHLKFSPALTPDGNPSELIAELVKSHRQKESILLVGHEPYLGRLISLLLSGDTSLPVVMKKGGLCQLSVDTLRYGRCARLVCLLGPRQLKRLK